ncbi:hypothetical protein tb265_17500 [Gemmatimonadetes bacterium T265]|nr:hypothetical protein tb265_17500 [Gemmatimonadetes bacterium T265]
MVVPGADPLFTRVRNALAHEFEVLREIGRGGMAAVFLARELTPRRMVAIKVMLPELAYSDSMPQRFLAEAQTAAMLEHPNIVTIFRTGEAGGVRYFAMRYIDGASLEQLLLVGGRFPVRLACYVLAEMARALDFAHGEGVVHRDVKPGNVMLDRRWGRAIVTDFGIAKVADGANLTRTGLTIGTPSYMSPELCRGLPPTSASDQYALGVVAYQLFTGAPTFVGTPLDVQNAHVREAPRPLRDLCPECPESLERAIQRMLEKRPEDRWPRLADAIPALLAHVGPEAECQEELRARLSRLGHAWEGSPYDRRTHERRSGQDEVVVDALPGAPAVAPATAEPLRADPVPAASVPAASVPAVSLPADPLPADPLPADPLRDARPVPVASVDVLPRVVHLAPGQTATLRALALSAEGVVLDGREVEWSVSDPAVAVVDRQGSVQATAPGRVLVRAACGPASATAEVAVAPSVAAPLVDDGSAADGVGSAAPGVRPASVAPALNLTYVQAPRPATPDVTHGGNGIAAEPLTPPAAAPSSAPVPPPLPPPLPTPSLVMPAAPEVPELDDEGDLGSGRWHAPADVWREPAVPAAAWTETAGPRRAGRAVALGGAALAVIALGAAVVYGRRGVDGGDVKAPGAAPVVTAPVLTAPVVTPPAVPAGAAPSTPAVDSGVPAAVASTPGADSAAAAAAHRDSVRRAAARRRADPLAKARVLIERHTGVPTLHVGETMPLVAWLVDSTGKVVGSGTVHWTSSDPSALDVSGGVARAKRAQADEVVVTARIGSKRGQLRVRTVAAGEG